MFNEAEPVLVDETVMFAIAWVELFIIVWLTYMLSKPSNTAVEIPCLKEVFAAIISTSRVCS